MMKELTLAIGAKFLSENQFRSVLPHSEEVDFESAYSVQWTFN